MTMEEYVEGCSRLPFVDMCRERFNFTDEELELEYRFWKAYAKEHIAESFPGIREFLLEYRARGGKICVSSMSSTETILRDYRTHFGFEPDLIFGWDLPEDKRKPDPYAPNAVMAHYGFDANDILIVDDMKFAVSMARKSGCAIAFAGWGRKEYPQVCAEMENLCDETFYTIEDLRNYLFQA
jgi:phosphoglycolate phosphatase/pyrophosphatase PpaX